MGRVAEDISTDVKQYLIKKMTMYGMLRVLEYQYAITEDQIGYLEFYDAPEELPYCLFFRISGISQQYTLRVFRKSDDSGFFYTCINLVGETVHGALLDWRMVYQSFLGHYSSVEKIPQEGGYNEPEKCK